jgi:hypothetical protein
MLLLVRQGSFHITAQIAYTRSETGTLGRSGYEGKNKITMALKEIYFDVGIGVNQLMIGSNDEILC